MKRYISAWLACVMVLTALLSTGVTVSAAEKPSIYTELDKLIEQYPSGTYWNSGNYETTTNAACTHHKNCDYYGECGCNSFGNAIQCFGFGKMIVYKLFGKTNGVYRDWKYSGDNEYGMTKIGSITSFTAENVKNLLKNARPGDVLQMSAPWQHTMIIYSIDDTGVTVFDCNWVKGCGIRLEKVSFGDWEGRNCNTLAVVRANNYDSLYVPTRPPVQNVPVVPVEGDVDGNGKLELADAMQVFYHVNQMTQLEGATLERADLDGNGAVGMTEAMTIFFMVNGIQ